MPWVCCGSMPTISPAGALLRAAAAGLHRSGDGSGRKMRVKATGGGAYKYGEVRCGVCRVAWCMAVRHTKGE